MGLLLAVSLTIANGGRRLIADCHPGLLDPSIPLDQGPGHTDCSFDPTRIYVSLFLLFTKRCPVCPGPIPRPSPLCYFLVLGYSLGSLDPLFLHVCSRGYSFWLLLCGCTNPTGNWALQEGRVAGTAGGADRT